MSMFRNVMVYLGLGPDEEYDDGYLYEDDEPEQEAAPAASTGAFDVPATGPEPQATSSYGQNTTGGASAVGTVRPLRPVGSPGPDFEDGSVTVRPLNAPAEAKASEFGAAVGGVQPMPVRSAKPKSLAPQSFGDAKILADEFKRATPVIMILQSLDRDLSRRLIDFASGVCYSLGGTMEKLATGVFLLIPKGVDVSAEDRRRIEERGFDR